MIRYDRRRADSTVPIYQQNVSMRVTAAAGRVGEVEIEVEVEVGVEDVSVLFKRADGYCELPPQPGELLHIEHLL